MALFIVLFSHEVEESTMIGVKIACLICFFQLQHASLCKVIY
jgi:hypothetical protein